MKLLLVKLSAMGDVIHALPAASDALRGGHTVHWLVEERFAPIPSWHRGGVRIIPIPLQRWKKAPIAALVRGEVGGFVGALRRERYDRVVDLQGLVKSAVVGCLAQGLRVGPHADWAREWLATFCYQRTVPVAAADHVVVRLRKVVAAAVEQPLPVTPPDFGLQVMPPPPGEVVAMLGSSYILFLHGAAWRSKLWPTAHWQALARLLALWPVTLGLPWGNPEERQRAEEIARAAPDKAIVLPAMGLGAMAALIGGARGAVGLDSGFAHLAAALGIPVVTLFGATNPDYSGIDVSRQRFVRSQLACAPCMARVCRQHPPLFSPCFDESTPERVADLLSRIVLRNPPEL